MRDWNKAIPALREALKEHFPDAGAEEREIWANELYDQSSPANSLERLERSDTRPPDDIDNIEAAARNLRLAADKLDKVGWHGGKALTDFAKLVRKMNEELPGVPIMGSMDSSVYLANFLRGLADNLSECAKEISPDAPSVMSAFDGNEKRHAERGAKKKTGAYFTARAAYDAFLALAGETPSVATKSGTAYGPFLSFVKVVFDCLAVDASAETWARKVCKEKKQTQN